MTTAIFPNVLFVILSFAISFSSSDDSMSMYHLFAMESGGMASETAELMEMTEMMKEAMKDEHFRTFLKKNLPVERQKILTEMMEDIPTNPFPPRIAPREIPNAPRPVSPTFPSPSPQSSRVPNAEEKLIAEIDYAVFRIHVQLKSLLDEVATRLDDKELYTSADKKKELELLSLRQTALKDLRRAYLELRELIITNGSVSLR